MGLSDSKHQPSQRSRSSKNLENVTYDMWGNVYKTAEQLELEALHKYNIRVKSYNHLHHGQYFEYLEWCKAQYYLDCIPVSCQQGPNYKPRYDNWGNQYY
jgi:hypothetical protein